MRGFQVLFVALAVSALFLNGASAANYTLQLVNNTGLASSQYTIYAMGFSTTSQLVMGSAGTFATQSSGTISSYPVGTGAGQISQILLATNIAFTGGRLYFFVVPVGSPAPSVTYGSQPANPPGAPYPNTIVEITVPAGTPATMDVQTVDGFIFPLTVTLNGQTNVAGQQYGQPIYTLGQTATVNRAAIFTAYDSFMTAAGAAGTPYLDMVFGAGSFAGQAGGILNPGAYLTAINPQNEYLNLGSSLNTAFDTDLATLFGTTTLRLQGVASGAGQSPVIATDTYSVTSAGNQTYPGTAISLPALQFTGDTASSNVFTVFNPAGIAVLTDTNGSGITGTITGSTLTLNSAVSGLSNGMYIAGAGITTSGNNSTTTIINVTTNISGHTVVTMSASLGTPAPNSQYTFCKLPQLVMFQTPGQMVMANSGVFADSTTQFPSAVGSATVLGNLENQIVSAFNRGVAVNATALNPPSIPAGGTSAVWGDQMNWYPASAVQNLFSLFMHVGSIGGSPIFFQPANASIWPNARGQVMGSAYGFAYDEDGGPIPPAPSGQPEVPSKFDQNVPVGATIQITFGQWTSAATPTPTPLPAPEAKVKGKKTIKTAAGSVKIKGTATGQEMFVKYKKKSGKTVTKSIKIKSNGQWVFKFKPEVKTTMLKFYAEDFNGNRSSVQKIKVIDSSD